MANLTRARTFGADVAKDTLVIFDWERQQGWQIANEPAAIEAWLADRPGPARLAVEPTSHYHRLLVDQAQARGYALYLVNPRQLSHYRAAVGRRNKTDPEDAWLLARYLAHEGSQLRVYRPDTPEARQLWTLLKRRAVVIKSRQQLQQSLREVQLSARALLSQFRQLLARIDRQILALLRQLGWQNDVQRCRSIPGIGPLNATALVAAYHRGSFANADAFIAFLGLDVRCRESGRFKGQRKLTKHGDAELRRLLYCAAKPARCHPPFASYHQRQLDKGLSKIAANVILSRKLARIAFALMRHQQSFQISQPT